LVYASGIVMNRTALHVAQRFLRQAARIAFAEVPQASTVTQKDLRDAISVRRDDHYQYDPPLSERDERAWQSGMVLEELTFEGLKTMTPAEFISKSPPRFRWLLAKPFGWMVHASESEVVEALTEQGEDREHYERILNQYLHGRLAPGVLIDGKVGDGIHRAYFHQAIGQKMTVALYASSVDDLR
jgi:hypothetical protein